MKIENMAEHLNRCAVFLDMMYFDLPFAPLDESMFNSRGNFLIAVCLIKPFHWQADHFPFAVFEHLLGRLVCIEDRNHPED